MATVYYKIVDLQQYLSDVENQLNTLGTDGWELSTIFNDSAILISGSSGISVTGSVILPAGVVSSSAQVKTYLPAGVVSSSTQATNWTVLSSSFTSTSSYVLPSGLPSGILSSSAFSSPSQGTVRLVVNGATTDVDLGVQTGDNVTFAQVTASTFHSTDNGNGTNFKVGDDAWIGDVNVANTIQVTGLQDSTTGYVRFGSNGNQQQIGSDGTNLTISMTSGSVNITSSLDVTGPFTASLQEGYIWVGESGNRSTAIPTSSMVAGALAYGQWYSTEIQSGSANTALPMRYNSESFARGFTYSGSRIYALQDGVYNMQFSAQFFNTANNTAKIDVWVRQDGNNVPDSNTLYEIDKQPSTRGTTVAALNYMVQMNSGSWTEIVWTDTNAGTVQLYSTGSATNPTRPAVPSVITTITQVG